MWHSRQSTHRMHLTVRPFILDAPFLPKVYVLNNVSVQPVTSSGKHTIYHPEVSHGSTVMRLCPGCYAYKQLDLANWSSNSSPLEVTTSYCVNWSHQFDRDKNEHTDGYQFKWGHHIPEASNHLRSKRVKGRLYRPASWVSNAWASHHSVWKPPGRFYQTMIIVKIYLGTKEGWF